MAGDDKILLMLHRGSILLLCLLLLGMGGCAKRQASRSLVVYVPSPPPLPAAPPAANPQVLVIEEPAPPPAPEPEETSPPQTPQPATIRRRPRNPARSEAPATTDDTSPEASPSSAQVPALEPRESSAEEADMRRQFLKLDQDIRLRLTRLDGKRLTANGRKTLQDARTFFAQATQALTAGDLPRALNLARKASLLLAALE